MNWYPKYPKFTSQKSIDEMSNQMKNSIYTIYKQDGITELGIGFFCYIKYENKNIPVLIIKGLILDPDDMDIVKIFKKKNEKEIELGETRLKNDTFNVTIFEIKENRRNRIHYLEIEDILYKEESEYILENVSIYIMKYFNINDIQVCPGVINNINDNSSFKYFGNVNPNSKGALIFSSHNNKIIGIHNVTNSNYINEGLFFNIIIKAFTIKYKHNKNSCNEINIIINVEKNEINKKIYFLDNYEQDNDENKCHENIKELLLNSDIFMKEIRKVKYKNKTNYFIPEQDGIFHIKLKFSMNLKDYSYMFAECHNIRSIDFTSFNTKKVTNMRFMFYECDNLETVYLFSFDTKNVNDFSCMFHGCKNLKNLDLSYFDYTKANDMSYMLYNCKNYKNLYLSSINTKKIDINYIFGYNITIIYKIEKNKDKIKLFGENFVSNNKDNCYIIIEGKKEKIFSELKLNKNQKENNKLEIKLIKISPIINLSNMFNECSSLESLPDINKWDTKNIINMSYMFYNCNKLYLNNLSK